MLMAKKKKPNISKDYWMKFGGSLRKKKVPKMNMGGITGNISLQNNFDNSLGSIFVDPGGPAAEWNGWTTPLYPGQQRQHVTKGTVISPTNPQYIPGEQRGGSSSSGSTDYVYRTNTKKPYKFHEYGGTPQDDPTFKMWFAKNARRPDVMKVSGNTESLKQLFLTDINQDQLPLFSNEMDDYGGSDKSVRPFDLSSKIIGGLENINTPPPSKRSIRNSRKAAGLKEGETMKQFWDQYFQKGLEEQEQIRQPKGYGGRNLPKAGSGIRIDATRDYSGIAERNPNWKQGMGTVGDTNILQKAGPWGILADMVFDAFGFSGDMEQHKDNVRDAHESTGTLNLLNRDGANKDSLDMSTRTDALNALAGYLGTPAPDFMSELAPELIQGVGAMATSGAGNSFNIGGGGGGEVGDVIDYDAISGGTHARYGGHMAAESGMDLRNLHRLENGGTLDLGPGAGTGIQKLDNPYSNESLMESSGIDQLSAGGPSTQNYEAEGGEAIMHAEGGQPATTGNLEEVSANVSMLEGSSHEKGGEEVTGEGEQYVFSKKLKSDTWKKSFADAAETIAKNIEKFEKVSTEEDSDEITKSTANAMIQSWQQKLMELQQEQETKRQEKFMDMMNNGAPAEELQKAFPDLYEQFMAEQQLQEQAQMQQGQGGMEQEAQMAANPMGDIDMSALSGDAQQMVGAKYGLPQYNHGGSHDEFTPYNFNQYFNDNFSWNIGDESDVDFGLKRNRYTPKKSELLDYLTINFPEEGYNFGLGETEGGDIYTNPKDAYNALLADFSTERGTHLEDKIGLQTKPKKDDYRSEITVPDPRDETKTVTSMDWTDENSQTQFNQDEAAWSLYNSGLPSNWAENFGADAGLSQRKYFKTLYTSLIAKGTDPEIAQSLVNKEKLQKEDIDAAFLEMENEEKELTDAEKAQLEIEKIAKAKKNKELLGNIGTTLTDLAPTFYNLAMGNKAAAKTPYVGNKYEDDILDNLEKIGNTDIEMQLDQNEETLNMAKYLARQHSDGSSGGYMTILNQFMNAKTEADRKAFFDKYKFDQAALTTANESLYNLGEKDRIENTARIDSDFQHDAAREAFTAKGWEGISGYAQLQQKMKNSANRDVELRSLLDDIYPDASLYMNSEGDVDIQKILGENPELIEYFQKYFKTN